MNKYVLEYHLASDEEKLEILRDIYKNSNSRDEKLMLTKEAQKIYNRLKGRE